MVGHLLRSTVLRKTPAAARIARVVADVSYLSYAAYQRRVARTFNTVFPGLSPVEIRRLTRTAWRSRVQCAIDQRELEALTSAQLIRYCESEVDVDGGDEFSRLCEAPEPIIVFSPHYGNFALSSLCMVLLASSRKRVHLFYNPPSVNAWAPTMARLVDSLNRNAGSILNDRTGPLRAMRALRKGDVIGIMPDVHDFDSGAFYVPFFGRLVMAMSGTAFLALRSGARLVPMYCYRNENRRFTLRFDPPISLASSDCFEQAVFDGTAQIFQSMERQFLALPEHWWFWDELMSRMAPGIGAAGDGVSARTQLRDLVRDGTFREPKLVALLSDLRARVDTAYPTRREDASVAAALQNDSPESVRTPTAAIRTS